jgi:FAD/FMN-containing dehydrogenase
LMTGSHGKSLFHGILSEMVLKWRIITSTGTIEEIDKGSEMYAAMGVSLGLLGIVSTVQLEVVPIFTIAQVFFAVDFEEFQRMWREGVNEKHEFVDYVWWPKHNRFQIQFMDKTTTKDPTTSSLLGLKMKYPNVLMGMLRSFLYVGSILGPFPPIVKMLQYPFASKRVSCHVSSLDNTIAARDCINVKFMEMEVAVPYDLIMEALESLRKTLEEHSSLSYFPIGIRVVRKDEFWLSPCYERDSVFIAFIALRYGLSRYKEYFKVVTDALLPYNIRFHWGKTINADVEYVKKQYPKLEEFVKLRSKMDPIGMFRNDYLDQFIN